MEVEDLGGSVSFWQKALWIFTSPSRCFEVLRSNPDWLKPWLLAVVVAVALGAIAIVGGDVRTKEMVESRVDSAETLRAEREEDYQPPSEEEREKKIAMYGQFYNFSFLCCAPIGGLLVLFLISGIVHIVAYVFGIRGTYRDMLSVWAYSGLILAVGNVVSRLLALATGNQISSLSLADLLGLDAASSALGAALSALSLFPIWHLAVGSIGLSIVRQADRKKCFALIFGLWLLLALISIAFSVALPSLLPTAPE